MNSPSDQEAAIFGAARQLTVDQRAGYLNQACAGDAALRQRIDELLRADGAAGTFMRELAPDTQEPTQNPVPASTDATVQISFLRSEKPGDQIGRYRLLQKIGEGGCGMVYMAQQQEPVKRRVALKVIKLGMDTRSVIARFDAERQALALLDHPNIAKVFDGGSTENGRPYFVMELVRGIKITDYCDQNNLTPKERLGLFIQVCHAVQHAHQKGIIHRDIKPSNILVTLHDGVPVPKVIDFGIAKATGDQSLTDKTLFTAFEQFIGTPAYMSPEQAEMSGLDVDTRSDIYSLGVLLYELLTGKTPFDQKELVAAGLDAMRRTIREKEPVRPSTRLSTMVEGELTDTAKHRQADPPKLISLVRGDLDWIVMKALEKDRQRRYETANGLAMDIQRHLSNEPVVARPPSQLYRLRKLTRRNRIAVAAAAAVATALVVGLTLSAWQAVRATRAQRAEKSARLAADESAARESKERLDAQDNARKATESEQNAQRLLYAADMKLANAAWEEGNLARMTSLLQAHRPKPEETDVRGFEYYYFQELAKGEQLQTLLGHTNSVNCLAVSPDGKWLASRGDTDTRLWDLSRRTLTAAWPSSDGDYPAIMQYGISFSSDSKYLAFPSEQGIQFCDLSTRQTRMFRSGTFDRPLFSPVTNLIAIHTGPKEPEIQVWDYLTNKQVGSAGRNRLLWRWTADGSRLLTGPGDNRNDTLEWRDTVSFKVDKTDHAAQFIAAAVVSQDGRLTAAADWQGKVWLLESSSGKVLGTMDCGDAWSFTLAFSPDSKFLATSSRDQAILVWDVATRQRVRQLRGHHSKVSSLAFSLDGQLLISGDMDGRILLWDMDGGNHRDQIGNRMLNTFINAPQFSADGKLLALAIAKGEWAILDTAAFQLQSSIKGEFASFSPDSRQLAFVRGLGRQPALRVMKIGAAAHRAEIKLAIPSTALRTELSPDGMFQAVERDGGIVLLGAATGERVLSVTDPGIIVGGFLTDGRTWACAVGPRIDFWDLESKRKTRSLDCGTNGVPHGFLGRLAISPDGRFLAATALDNKILLWDLPSRTEPRVFTGHQAYVYALAFSADGRTLASGGEDRVIKFWDLATGREIASFVEEKPVYCLSFSPDNQMLVWGGIGSYHIWRAPRGESAPSGPPKPAILEPPATSVWQIPDGDAPEPAQMATEKSRCLTNMFKIYAAILSYQKDHQQMPDWLSDLVPKYLDDTNSLMCPSHAATRILPTWLPTEDPKVTTSYGYEFSAQLVSGVIDYFDLKMPGDTRKAWRTKQLARYGIIVPVLRCAQHHEFLTITYAGELFEGPYNCEGAADVKWRAKEPAAAEQWYHKMEQDGNAGFLNQLAWNWSTSDDPSCRDGRAAVRFAQKAVELTNRKDPGSIDTLSAAYAETGQFDKAVSVQLEAISILKASTPDISTEMQLHDLEGRLDLYRRRQPYHEVPFE